MKRIIFFFQYHEYINERSDSKVDGPIVEDEKENYHPTIQFKKKKSVILKRKGRLFTVEIEVATYRRVLFS